MKQIDLFNTSKTNEIDDIDRQKLKAAMNDIEQATAGRRR
jgi:hypothetical protein